MSRTQLNARTSYFGLYLCLVGLATVVRADEPKPDTTPSELAFAHITDFNASSPNDLAESDKYFLTSATLLQPAPEVEPSIEQAPVTPPPPAMTSEVSTELSTVFSVGPGRILASLSDQRQVLARGPASSAVLGLESEVLVTTDTGSLLSRSNAVLGLAAEHRTPIVTYNSARGWHVGQQAGSGSYWFAARQDLDTLLSKLDSRIIQDVLVIKGPYSSVYGPAFSFYDVELMDAPRYPGGPETHFSTSLDWKENGDQWYGRQTVWGGSGNWGFRIGYGERAGSDYETGISSFEMPTSYNSRDWDVAVGYDPSPDEHIDFHYLRLDQTDVEFPGQMFDMRYLVTDAYELEYVNEGLDFADRVEAEGWYNRTRFAGDNLGAGKRRQIPFLDQDLGFGATQSLIGFTDVSAMSTGYSAAVTWGCETCGYFKFGSDLRQLKQNLNEITSDVLSQPGFPPFTIGPVVSPIANARSSNPGLFFERGLAVNPCLTVRAGGRVDWVDTNSDPTSKRFIEDTVGDDLSRDFFLFSGYLTAERKVGRHWTVDLGGGYAMRPPTMTELYADNPFIAVLPQLVVTRVIGNPNLDASRLYQIDVGMNADYPRLRCGANGFYAWITDYITYDFVSIPLGGGDTFNPVNTPLATQVGGEAYMEYDLNNCLTGFATASYIQGKDRTRDESVGNIRASGLFDPDPRRSASDVTEEALPVIAPLQSRVGLRWHDPGPEQRWAVEFAARIVDDQDRFAATLTESPTPGFTIYDIRAYSQATDNLLLTVGVENLFDKFYQEHFDPRRNPGAGGVGLANLGVFQPGVTFYTGFDWTY